MNTKYITNQDLKNAIKIAEYTLESEVVAPIKGPQIEFRKELHQILLDQMLFGYIDFDLDMIVAVYLYHTIVTTTNPIDLPFSDKAIQYAKTLSVILNENPGDSADYIYANHSTDNDYSIFFIFIGIYCQLMAINDPSDDLKGMIHYELDKSMELVKHLQKHIDRPKRYSSAKESNYIAVDHINDVMQLTNFK